MSMPGVQILDAFPIFPPKNSKLTVVLRLTSSSGILSSRLSVRERSIKVYNNENNA